MAFVYERVIMKAVCYAQLIHSNRHLLNDGTKKKKGDKLDVFDASNLPKIHEYFVLYFVLYLALFEHNHSILSKLALCRIDALSVMKHPCCFV